MTQCPTFLQVIDLIEIAQSRRERQGSEKSSSFLNNTQFQALHLPLVVSTGGVLDAFWDGAEQEPTRETISEGEVKLIADRHYAEMLHLDDEETREGTGRLKRGRRCRGTLKKLLRACSATGSRSRFG
jgi:hypothetical protein